MPAGAVHLVWQILLRGAPFVGRRGGRRRALQFGIAARDRNGFGIGQASLSARAWPLETGTGTADSVSVATGFLRPVFEGSAMPATGLTVTAPRRPPLGSPMEIGIAALHPADAGDGDDQQSVKGERSEKGRREAFGLIQDVDVQATLLTALRGRVLRLGHHVDLEAGGAEFGGHLRDRVPDGFLVGADVDALRFTVLPPDGGREIVDVYVVCIRA